MFAQSINVSPFSGVSAFGDPSYSTPVCAAARVEPVRKTLYSANGEEMQSEYAIYTLQQISMLDRVWLPGDSPADPTKARVPMKVYQGIDTDGSTTHYEVFV